MDSYYRAVRRKESDIFQFQIDNLSFVTYSQDVLPPTATAYENARKTGKLLKKMLATDMFNRLPIRVVDVGTGSGVIAVTIGDELRQEIDRGMVNIIATDISDKALEIAHINAAINGLEVINFRQRNVLEGVSTEFGRPTVIVSNPPFYPESYKSNSKNSAVPDEALYSGRTGLEFYERLFDQARDVLDQEGFIIVQVQNERADEVVGVACHKIPGAHIRYIRSGLKRRISGLIIGSGTIFKAAKSL